MYYPIDENTARRAKEAISFYDYIPGSATAAYREEVDQAAELAARQKAHTDPMYHEKIDSLLDLFARKLAENINAGNRITASCPSVMIAGPANFPVKKKQRQNAAADRNMEEYREIQKILDKIRGIGKGGIRSDDPNALDKLTKKLEALQRHQDRMKEANAAIRMKDTDKGNAKLFAMGYTLEEIRQLREPDFCGRIGYPSYELQNNNANIHRIRERIQQIEKQQAGTAREGWKFEGGEIVMNTVESRLQVIFDEKPDNDTRTELKSNGFRWAPSQGAWQRQLTDNALRAAEKLFPKKED